jgi:hypothetical protein
MSERKPIPVQGHPQRRLCPVCGTASYSQTGTHPQCALAREDALSKVARKAAEVKIEPSDEHKSWSKACPKCKRRIPARRFVCDCGHQFAPTPSAGSAKVGAATALATQRKRR